MSKFHRTLILLAVTMLVVSCTAPTSTPPTQLPTTQPDLPALPEVSISRHPQPDDYSRIHTYTEPPTYDLNSTEQWQMDLRSSDLTGFDLSKSKNDLLFADFDSKTKWPTPDKMPVDFDWQKIMELGKDPGLGMRALHDQGITGNGIGIAIIDQILLTDHIEFKDQIRVYEEAEDIIGGASSMHGPAVASIAVGRTVGVAPDADLYFIATEEWGNLLYTANLIRRVIEINETLPQDRKIRVLSIAKGWMPNEKGYDEIISVMDEAKTAGIFVISSSLSQTHGLNFHALGREPLADPNQFASYEPGLWWQDYFYENGLQANTLLVPMDSRTTASPTGTEDYVFYREGGWSWSIPYIAGTYALAAQVKPDITPETFWETALQTGRTIQLQHDGKEYDFGVILDPQVLIEALQTK
jgi:hypothetical protein